MSALSGAWRGPRLALAASGAMLLFALASTGGLGGWVALRAAHQASDGGRSIEARLEAAARAVGADPLLPSARGLLARTLEEAIATLGADRVAALAPSAPVPRFRFVSALARAGFTEAAAGLAVAAVPSRAIDVEVFATEEVLALARLLAAHSRCPPALPLFELYRRRGGSESRTDLEEGRCLLAVGDAMRARPRLERAARSAPASRWIAYNLAEAELAAGDAAAALQSSERLLEREPDYYFAERLRARALEALGRAADAAEAYGRAADLDPEKRFNRVDEARMHLAAGDARRAIAVAAPLVAADPAEPFAALILAEAELVSGDAATALSAVQVLLDRDPALYGAWRLRGRAHEALGDAKAAAESYGRAADLDREKRFNRVDEARMRLAAGETATAIAILERTVAADPTDRFAGHVLAEARLRAGDAAGALRETERLVVRSPDDAEAWGLRARILEADRRFAEAADAFGRAAGLAPLALHYRVSAGRCRLRAGDAAQAIAMLEPVVAAHATDFWAAFFLAEARLTDGDVSAAATEVARLVERFPRAYHAWHLRGRVMETRGDRDQAAASFAKALELAPEKAWLRARIAALRDDAASSAGN